MNTAELLRAIMRERFSLAAVLGPHRPTLRENLTARIGKIDPAAEGFADPRAQRDLSVRFHWGHDHDFGEFALSGRMGERHIDILAEFIDRFGLPADLRGASVLDVGVWTGGTSLLLAAMGARVVALEEVRKYAATVGYLAEAFGISNLTCRPISAFDLDEHDIYDYVICAGVIYHVTDPILLLRILFDSLKNGGRIFVETYAADADEDSAPLALVEGPQVTRDGSESELDRAGWNYFIPSRAALRLWMETVGFVEVDLGGVDSNRRLCGAAMRERHVDMLRAGLSRRSVR